MSTLSLALIIVVGYTIFLLIIGWILNKLILNDLFDMIKYIADKTLQTINRIK